MSIATASCPESVKHEFLAIVRQERIELLVVETKKARAARRPFGCRLLLPGACEPRLARLGARSWISAVAPLTQREPPEHGCRWQLYFADR